jgi:hypothetical protein
VNANQLLSRWLLQYSETLPSSRGILRVRRAEPILGRGYRSRFKIETATFDGTGQNPSDVECFVLEISESDQTAQRSSTTCDSIKDL